jgi:hypothetical protein
MGPFRDSLCLSVLGTLQCRAFSAIALYRLARQIFSAGRTSWESQLGRPACAALSRSLRAVASSRGSITLLPVIQLMKQLPH